MGSRVVRHISAAAEPRIDDRLRLRRATAEFPRMVEAAYRRRRLLDRLVRIRERRDLTQKDVAQRLGTSQAEVSRIESAEVDLRSSTLETRSAPAVVIGVTGFGRTRSAPRR